MYLLRAAIGIDNGFGNNWSESEVILDENFKVVSIMTYFLGNNAEPDPYCDHETTKYEDLTYDQWERLSFAVSCYKQVERTVRIF